jgi:disulfide bond formation protein DsbB
MSIFIERFFLAILATLAVLLAVTNPMGFSRTTRIIAVIAIFILAGIAAYFSEWVQRERVQREQLQHDERIPKTPSSSTVSATGGGVAAGRDIRNSQIDTRDGSKC